MPELPEVETIARGLRRAVVGASIERVVVRRGDVVREGSPRALRALAGRTVRAVSRRGKYLLLDIDGAAVAIHLGMTGRVRLEPSGTPPDRHTHIILHLRDGREVHHGDPRRFGFVAVSEGARPACLAALGPEPLDLGAAQLADILARRDRQMKPLLMDQRVIAGIGNIYADEILFRARIHPLTRSGRLSPRRAAGFCRAIRTTLNQAIARNGTSVRDYVTAAGAPGGFQRFLRVYGRAGQPCRRCGRRIVRITVGQRGTWYCPNCQRLPGGAGGRSVRI